jgi:hypothetical protein
MDAATALLLARQADNAAINAILRTMFRIIAGRLTRTMWRTQRKALGMDISGDGTGQVRWLAQPTMSAPHAQYPVAPARVQSSMRTKGGWVGASTHRSTGRARCDVVASAGATCRLGHAGGQQLRTGGDERSGEIVLVRGKRGALSRPRRDARASISVSSLALVSAAFPDPGHVPVGLCVIALALRHVVASRDECPRTLDLTGRRST